MMRRAWRFPDHWRTAIVNGALRRALIVAVIVGTLLNVINQGDVLLSGGTPDWAKAALTYLVPFFVSMHGAISTQKNRQVT